MWGLCEVFVPSLYVVSGWDLCVKSLYEVPLEGISGKSVKSVLGFCLRVCEATWGPSLCEVSVCDLWERCLCEKSLFRGVSVKSLCIVSGSLHFFFLLVSLFLVLLYLMEDGAAREVQRDLLFLFSCCSISITCLWHFSQQEPGESKSNFPIFPELTSGCPWEDPAAARLRSQPCQLFPLGTDISHKSWLHSHCSAHSGGCLGNWGPEVGPGSREKPGVWAVLCSLCPLHPRSQHFHMLRGLTGMGDGVHFCCHLDQGHQLEQKSPQWERHHLELCPPCALHMAESAKSL